MNAHQEIAAYRGWPVTNYGITKTECLYSARDGAFVPVHLAAQLACEIDSLERRVEQLTKANTYIRTVCENQKDRARNTLLEIKRMILDSEDFDGELAIRKIEAVVGPFME